MTGQRFRVICKGEIEEGKTIDIVKENLSNLLKTDIKNVERFFSGKPELVKKNSDLESSQKIINIFNKAGVVCHMEEELTNKKSNLMNDCNTKNLKKENDNKEKNKLKDKIIEGDEKLEKEKFDINYIFYMLFGFTILVMISLFFEDSVIGDATNYILSFLFIFVLVLVTFAICSMFSDFITLVINLCRKVSDFIILITCLIWGYFFYIKTENKIFVNFINLPLSETTLTILEIILFALPGLILFPILPHAKYFLKLTKIATMFVQCDFPDKKTIIAVWNEKID